MDGRMKETRVQAIVLLRASSNGMCLCMFVRVCALQALVFMCERQYGNRSIIRQCLKDYG